jgi:hypothetical protein
MIGRAEEAEKVEEGFRVEKLFLLMYCTPDGSLKRVSSIWLAFLRGYEPWCSRLKCVVTGANNFIMTPTAVVTKLQKLRVLTE